MELRFDRALCWVGWFLIAIGISSILLGFFEESKGSGFSESIAQAFSTVFSALFSGVMFGVGFCMLACGFLLGSKRQLNLPFMLFLSSVFSLCAALAAISLSGEQSFIFFLIFFAGIAASFSFMLASVISLFSSMAKKYATQPAPDGCTAADSAYMPLSPPKFVKTSLTTPSMPKRKASRKKVS